MFSISIVEFIKFYKQPKVWAEERAIMYQLSMARVLGHPFMSLVWALFLLMLNPVYVTFQWHWFIADIEQVYDFVDL